MNLKLERTRYDLHGIFGSLSQEDGTHLCTTLEHAFMESGEPLPKIPPGVYTCVSGTHQLHDAVPFETFEITGVPGHSGLLFHAGNFNKDSEGCVLLGEGIYLEMITHSREAFSKFMGLQAGLDSFTLEVR